MKFLPLLLVFLLFACNQPAELQQGNALNIDSTRKSKNLKLKKKLEERYFEKVEREDSLLVIYRVDSIMKLVDKRQYNGNFSIHNNRLKAKYGNVFSATSKHLYINIKSSYFTCIYIYAQENKKLKPVHYYKEFYHNYRGDSITDINGDGFKDFVVNWEAAAHNWMDNSFKIYLYNKADRGFKGPFDVINPTFSPKEKLVRGITYGMPGEAELYKIKWNGFTPDTVELIARIKGDYKHFMRITERPFWGDKKGKIINDVPNEYKSIYDFDYFLGNPDY